MLAHGSELCVRSAENVPPRIADGLRERLGAARVSVQRIDRERRVFTVVAASGDKLFSPGSELPVDTSTQILLAEQGDCFASADFGRVPGWERPADLLVQAAGFRSGFTVPLWPVGAVSASFADVGEHGRRVEEARRVAPLLAQALADLPPALLTRREHELLAALERGLLFKEIALALGISQTTVKGYARSLFRKLGAHTRGEAVYVARRRGLL